MRSSSPNSSSTLRKNNQVNAHTKLAPTSQKNRKERRQEILGTRPSLGADEGSQPAVWKAAWNQLGPEPGDVFRPVVVWFLACGTVGLITEIIRTRVMCFCVVRWQMSQTPVGQECESGTGKHK